MLDLQVGLLTNEEEAVYNAEVLLQNVKSLLDLARWVEIERIFVQHNGNPGDSIEPGTPGWAIHPAVFPLDGELVIQKTTPSAFFRTTLNDDLKIRDIHTLIITGLRTEYCFDSTVRHASFLGYKVIVVSDAHSTIDGNCLTASQIIAHHNIILGAFAEVRSTAEIHAIV